MYFNDWASHPNEGISANLLWEYDISSPLWDWKKMDVIVVSRVIERGWPKDYYAMFHLYGEGPGLGVDLQVLGAAHAGLAHAAGE